MDLEAAATVAPSPDRDEIYQRYLQVGDPLYRTFWQPAAGADRYALGHAPPHVAQARQLHAKQTLYRDRLISTYQDAVDALRQSAVEQREAMGSHAELQVSAAAPSRCPSGTSGPRVILSENEVQRGAYHLFAPGAPRQWRRVLAELTPGLGKTCIYIGVMAKFLGRICAETNRYFDIVVVGDDDIFNAFRSGLRSCPATVNVAELIEIEERRRNSNESTVYSVLSRRGDGRRYADDHAETLRRQQGRVFLRDVNPTIETANGARLPSSGFCAVNTHLASNGGAGAKSSKDASPFEREKSEAACGPNAYVWGGSRVFFIKYAIAARWTIYTGAGVPAHEAAQHLDHFEDETARSVFTSFKQLQRLTGDASLGKLANRDDVLEQKPPNVGRELHHADGVMPSEEAIPGKVHAAPQLPKSATYSSPHLVLPAANTVLIIDEAHQLLQPYEQRYGDEATRREGVAFSEALWRNSDNIYTTPYLFCGTATPNPTTDVSLTPCMYQLINAKLRATSFLPFLVHPDGSEHTIQSTAEYRKLLGEVLLDDKLRSGRTELKFRWRRPHERTARYLVVNPRTFLEASNGFVREMTLDPTSSARTFPLRLPLRAPASSVVVGWEVPSGGLGHMTYGEASKKVRACLPDAPVEETTRTTAAYLTHDVRNTSDNLQNALAHSNFVCAARREDALLQAQRIYKPIYEDDLNRLFLQDMCYSRVFTANSYPDYRYFPALVPNGAYGEPLTRCVDPYELLTSTATAGGSPRAKAAAAFPTAVVYDVHGQPHDQNPWTLPLDAAERYAANLQEELGDDVGRACRWSERSFWAKCDSSLLSLARRLVQGYLQAPHAVDLALEAELQREVAYNSPKLVAAADDLYGGSGNEGNAFAPLAPIRGKSYYYLNVKDRRYPAGEPPPTALPPPSHGRPSKRGAAKKTGGKGKKKKAVGGGALAGLDDNAFIVVASFYIRQRCRPYLQHLLANHRDDWPELYRRPGVTLQHGLGWLDALLGVGVAAPAEAFHPGSKGPEPKSEVWALHWLAWRAVYKAQRVLPHHPDLYVPSLYCLADAKMTEDDARRSYEKYHRYLAGRSADGADSSVELTFDDALLLMGMPELRKAMVDAQNYDDPCVGHPADATPASQSGIFAADNAYKAVDLKCDGFNLCFGPLPRGKRIQQMGRNRRGCEFDQLNDLAAKPLNWRIYLRQSFLVPSASPAASGSLQQLLLQDCLLDSFYAEQNEANEWMRAIAVSASIGCSLWWSFSKWAELFASYHEHVPRGAMDWFFRNPAGTACGDATPPRRRTPLPADASLEWHVKHGRNEEAQTGLYRCSRHSTTELGSVVPSFLGALRAEDVVLPPSAAPDASADPSCARGSAVEYCTPLHSPRARPPRATYRADALFK